MILLASIFAELTLPPVLSLIVGAIVGCNLAIILKVHEFVIKPIFGWDKYNEWPWEKIMIKRRKEGRHGRQGGIRQGD